VAILEAEGGSGTSELLLGLFGFGAQGHGKHRTTDILDSLAGAQEKFGVSKFDGDVTAEQEQNVAVRADDVADFFGAKFVLDALVSGARAGTTDEAGEHTNAPDGLGLHAGNLAHRVNGGFLHLSAEGESGNGAAEQGEDTEGLHGKRSMEIIGKMEKSWSGNI
jgi:hypothetical protein